MKDKIKKLIKECIKEMLSERKKINESMTLTVANAPFPRFENMVSIGSFLNRAAFVPVWESWTEFEKEHFMSKGVRPAITTDGESALEDVEGVINFYTKSLQPDQIKEVLRKINAVLTKEKFGFQWPPRADKSGAYKSGVYRIFITNNPEATQQNDFAPEINFSNDNMRVIMNVLGYKLDDYGELEENINAMDLLSRIKSLKQQSLSQHVRPHYDSEMEKFKNPNVKHQGPQMIDFGLNEDDIMRRLDAIEQLAHWAIKNKHMEIAVM